MTDSFYDSVAGHYDQVYALPAHETAGRMATVLRELDAPWLGRVVSLGVGTGRELPALVDAGLHAIGLDTSERMLAIAKHRSPAATLMRGNMFDSLPFRTGELDGAMCLHGTLMHAPDMAELTSLAYELYRALKAGSSFVAEMPTAYWLNQLGNGVETESMRAWRAGASLVTVDVATGATLVGRIWSEAELREAFDRFDVTIKDTGIYETLMTARRIE